MREWEVWDLQAKQMRTLYGHPKTVKDRYYELRKQIADMIKGKSVLDAGCGHGHLYPLLPNGVVYVGFDNSKEMIRIAHEYFPNVTFVYGDVFSCSMYFDKADSVVAVDVLIHLPDIVKPISELWSLTNKCLIFTVKLDKKSEIKKLSRNRFPNETFKFPNNKYLIIRWDTLEDVMKILDKLPNVKEISHYKFDPRTEIFEVKKNERK